MAKVAIGFWIAAQFLCKGDWRKAEWRHQRGHVRRTRTRVKKKSPAEAGVSSSQFGVIFKTAGDRGGPGSRPASPCPVGRDPGARGSKQSKIVQLHLLATVIWRKGWDSNPRGSVNPLAVFKTAALNHSATLPSHCPCYVILSTTRWTNRRLLPFCYRLPFARSCSAAEIMAST